ncbi:MAG: hypothetical protein WBQ94_29120 [Terracidiphilus sp.]
MPKNGNIGTGNQATVSSVTPAPDHLTVTVSGPPLHVRAALTNMKMVQPTPLLCQQIALAETKSPDAHVSDSLQGVGLVSPELRMAYTERCALSLQQQTGFGIQASALPQDSTTTVQAVAEAMFDATA